MFSRLDQLSNSDLPPEGRHNSFSGNHSSLFFTSLHIVFCRLGNPSSADQGPSRSYSFQHINIFDYNNLQDILSDYCFGFSYSFELIQECVLLIKNINIKYNMLIMRIISIRVSFQEILLENISRMKKVTPQNKKCVFPSHLGMEKTLPLVSRPNSL